MLFQALDYAAETAKWGFGINNVSAMLDVVSDNYQYHTGYDHSMTKIKQIGTEVLHAGLKYATIAALGDKSLTYLNVFPSPSPATFRQTLHTALGASLELPAAVFPHMVAIGGAVFLAASGASAVMNFSEGVILTTKTFQRNNDDMLEFRPHNTLAGFGKILTAATALPIFAACYTYGFNYEGFTAVSIVTLPYLIAVKSDNALVKTAYIGFGLTAVLPNISYP